MTCEFTLLSKLRVPLLLLICLCLFHTGNSQTVQGAASAVPITLSAKRTTLGDIFEHIIKETGITVWYSGEVGNREARDVSFKNTPLRTVLDKVLPKDLSWKFRGKEIIITKKGISESSVDDPKDNTLSKTGLPENLPVDIDVTGRVIDENGDPIPGATILIKGSKRGTTTDANGNFSLTDVPASGVVSVSSVSFLTKDIAINKRAAIGSIQLSKYVGQLDETIVLAYTKTTNRLLTGNVSKVSAKDIKNSPVSNPILAVVGRAPGIQISQSTGFAGGGVNIVIQGQNSLQRGIVPFYVIDGVPFAQSLVANLGSMLGNSGRGDGTGVNLGSPLSYINPADIESIEILKDADATAIYGSRAGNGAIIITTKRGKAGGMRLNLNFQTGWGRVARRLNLLNTKEYLNVRREAFSNDNIFNIPSYAYDLNGTWDSTKNTDWQKELLGGKAKYNDAQVELSGGNANIRYLIGGNYHRESTVFPTNLADTKVSTRINLDVSSTDKRFVLNFSGSYLLDNNRLPLQDLTRSAMSLPPNMPDLKNADGTLNWGTNSLGVSTISPHPLAYLQQQYKNYTSNLVSNIVLNYKVFDNLVIKSNFGYNSLLTDEIVTTPLSAFAPERRVFAIRTSEFGFNSIKSWIVEPQINYNWNKGLGELSVIVGGSFQQVNKSRNGISASGFANDLSLENLNAATSVSIPMSSILSSEYKYSAGFLQLNYNWNNRYLLNVSGRRDGSSRFGLKSRFHNFGAIGASWIFSEEDFFQKMLSFVSFGKLKASYGVTGNDQIGDYVYESLYQDNNGDIPYRGGTSLLLDKINNPYLQWEETRKLSVGLDLGLFSDKFLLNTVYYRNRSSNMLVQATIPATSGPTLGLVANLPAVILNNGFEIAVTSYQIRKKDLQWSTSINLTIPRNSLTYFPNLESSPYAYIYVIGQPANLVRRYRSSGVNQQTGMYEFLDKDNKVTNTPNSDPANFNDYINPNPDWYGGFLNSLTYRRLSFDILFQFVKQLGENTPFSASSPGEASYNFTTNVLNRWRKEGDVASVQRLTTENFDLIDADRNQLSSNAYWEDASFIRLKNVALSYNFGDAIMSRLKLKELRAFINAQNLLTITPYNGLDPETKLNFSMPPLRVITIGIHASL